MAKLSGDDNSWKAEGLREKYSDWESREHKPKTKKASKKKWCKGRKGVPHTWGPVWKVYGIRQDRGYMIAKCSNCGREDWNTKLLEK